MSSNHDRRPDAQASTRENAPGPKRIKSIRELHQLQLDNTHPRVKAAGDRGGNDPYNTSGSFDRTKNWARVGKR